ncbi:unnamed protein product [Alternaria alternata]
MSSASTHPVRRLSLYCPDLNKNWYNFLITPSMTWEDMIVSIQAAFQYHDPVWPLDINGEPFSKTADVFNLASVQNGEELLIQLREGFRIVGPLDLEVVLYLEESDPGALETTLRVQDVLNAIQNLYEAAGAIGSTWETTKDNKAITKRFDRSKSYKAGKKGEAATARYNNDAEYMGEDAAEAAYPGKGKGKAMGMLAGRLEKTLLPDNHMDSDDDKDDSDYME